MVIDKEHLKEIFEDWIREQVDCWCAEYEAWDHMIGAEITEEDWEWIRDNLTVGAIEIKEYEKNE